ncbi:MAG: hypothetical protein HYY51_04890 [Candidatus Magasanikbacteria bacterium]|nr:hypothetical protein [Candidatus Magasanikbacteria bacterium]
MFSLAQTIRYLYPSKTDEEQQAILDACQDRGSEYYSMSWKNVQRPDLLQTDTKYHLIKTLHQFQFYYEGVVDDILRSLEGWSDGSLVFADFSEEDQDFYERFYTFFAWMHFDYISAKRQLFLLGTRFLLKACIWEIPIYTHVQDYFRRLAYVRGMWDDSLLFARIMARNHTLLGTEGKAVYKIGEWLDMFDNYYTASIESKVPEFMNNMMEVSRQDTDTRAWLEKIMTLYYGLQGGFIWREIEDGVPAGYERKQEGEKKNVDEYYLQNLYEADEKGIEQWLEDYEQAVHWLDVTQKEEAYITKLLFILMKKVDLNKARHVELLTTFLDALKARGLQSIDEVIYFDEKSQTFKWDESFFTGVNI